MNFKRFCWLAAFFVGINAAQLHGASIAWTNVNGGTWSAPLNWSTHTVPGNTDFALITTPGTYTVTVDVSVNVLGLTLGGASGTQTLTNSSQSLAITNTLIAANGVFNFGGGNWSGGLITNQGTINLNGGGILAPQLITSSGLLNATGSGVGLESPVTNNGTIRMSGSSGSITLFNNHGIYSGAIYNQPGGLFDIQNTLSVNSAGYGFEFFVNAGTLRKSGGASASTIGVLFTNTGTVDVQVSSIIFSGSGNLSGTYNTTTNTAILFNSGTYTESGTVSNSGAGLFELNGATVTLNDRITKFILAAGNVYLSPTFQGSGAIQSLQIDGATLLGTNRVTGTLGMNGASVGPSSSLTIMPSGILDLNGGGVTVYAPLTNNGTINWSGANITIANNAGIYIGAIYNQPGGLFDLQNDAAVASDGYGHEFFVNAGIVRKTAGLGTSSFSVTSTNTGTIDAQTGTIQFNSGGNLGGTYNTAGSARIQFGGGNYMQTGTVAVTGSGLCQENGAAITLTDQITNLVLASGNVTLSPTFQTNGTIQNLQLHGALLTGTNRVSGTLGFDGGGLGSASPLTVMASGTVNFNGAAVTLYAPLTNYGIINWSSGNLSIGNNAGIYTGTIINQPGGQFLLTCDQSFSSQGYGSEYFINAGTLRKTSGLGTTPISVVTTNTGTVDAESGIIQFSGGGNLGGTYNTASSATIQFNGGTFTENGPTLVTGAGLCRENGANVVLNDQITNLVLVAGNVMLSPTFQAGGTIQNLQLHGASLVGTNRVAGTLSFDGGGLASASPLTIMPSGVVNFNGAGVTLYAPLTNNGIINWSSGAVNIANNAGIYTGTLVNQSGGLFNLECDQSLASSGYGFESFSSAGTLRKTAGLGSTTISVPFANTGTLDAQSGTIRIAGPYTQTGGAMNFGITSLAFFGKISFAASAPIGGALSVNFNDGYFPSIGDSFALLTYASESGAFTTLNLPPSAVWQTNYSGTTFTLSVVGAGAPPVLLKAISYVAGNFTLQINGTVGPSYILLGSTNFSTWTAISTNTPSSMPFNVIDSHAGQFNSRFYRVQVGP